MGAFITHPHICRKTRCKILTTLPKLRRKKKGGEMHRAEEKKKNTRRVLVLLCVCMCGWCLKQQSMKKKGERGEALSIHVVTRVQGTKEENSSSFPNLSVQQCNETTATGKCSAKCVPGQFGWTRRRVTTGPSPCLPISDWVKRHFSCVPLLS